MLGQPCNKFDICIKLMLQVPNKLFQTSSELGQVVDGLFADLTNFEIFM